MSEPRDVCVALTFVVRILAVLFKWTLPEQIALRRRNRAIAPGTGNIPRP